MRPPPETDPAPPEAGQTAREPYTPPRVRVVELTAQEALMGICKGGLGAGPMGVGCGNGAGGPCMGGGS